MEKGALVGRSAHAKRRRCQKGTVERSVASEATDRHTNTPRNLERKKFEIPIADIRTTRTRENHSKTVVWRGDPTLDVSGPRLNVLGVPIGHPHYVAAQLNQKGEESVMADLAPCPELVFSGFDRIWPESIWPKRSLAKTKFGQPKVEPFCHHHLPA